MPVGDEGAWVRFPCGPPGLPPQRLPVPAVSSQRSGSLALLPTGGRCFSPAAPKVSFFTCALCQFVGDPSATVSSSLWR